MRMRVCVSLCLSSFALCLSREESAGSTEPSYEFDSLPVSLYVCVYLCLSSVALVFSREEPAGHAY